jgi:Bacterial SH3 domain
MTVRKIPHRNIALVLAAALLLVLFTGIARAEVCVVADPTGTPLNVRKRPSQHAPIIGALNNGIAVQTKMSLGDWVRIVPHEAPGKSGWAWRKFIDCSPPRPTEQSLPQPIQMPPLVHGTYLLRPGPWNHTLLCMGRHNLQAGNIQGVGLLGLQSRKVGHLEIF